MLRELRQEVLKMIEANVQRLTAAPSGGVFGVLSNHTLTNGPAATTALTTAAPLAMCTAVLTVRATGRFRVQVAGSINANNTLQAIITPILSFTQNGTNTFQAGTQASPQPGLPAFALPGATSNPDVGVIVGFFETSAQANTVGFAPTQGQTVACTLLLGASTTGGTMFIGGVALSMQEIF